MQSYRRTLGVSVPVLLVVVALVGWLASREESYADRDWSALEPAAAGVPQVRAPDPRTTRDSLAALDPCSIGAAGESDATRVPGDPGTCTVHRLGGTVVVHTSVAYLVGDGAGLTLDAVNALDSRDREDVAGIATWVGDGAISPLVEDDDAGCSVVVPASLDLALAIVGDSADCDTVTATAEAALSDLGALLAADPPPPACDLLATAVRADEELRQDLSTCDSEELTLTVGRSPMDDAHLFGQAARVGGAEVQVADDGRACAYEWTIGTAERGRPLKALLQGGPCPELEKRLARVLAQGNLPAPTLTEPVFYAADEPTPGGEGGCAELGDQLAWLCAPFTPRKVPDDPVEVIREGEADPDLLCAAALDVAEDSGLSLAATTTAGGLVDRADRAGHTGRRQCTLLEPTTTASGPSSTTITISASRDPVETVGNTSVADHPAYHSAAAGTWEIALTTTTERGHLEILVATTTVGSGREEPDWARSFVTDLVERLWD